MTPDFAAAFREEAFTTLEYSLGETPGVLGALVGGESRSFAERALAFARTTTFGGTWARAAAELVRRVPSSAYLFRVDGRGHAPLALSLYADFPPSFSASALREVLAAAAPLAWEGPSPHDLARVLGMPAPSGVGVRVDVHGRLHTAFYFRPRYLSFRAALPNVLPSFVRACGLGDDVAGELARVMPPLYGEAPLGVVGVDPGASGTVGALKLDPAYVPMARALAFLRARGVADAQLHEAHALARSLRAAAASYLGVKFRTGGFGGWRLYFTTSPGRGRPAGTAEIASRGRSLFFIPQP
jgi:hypothetical protein